MSDRTRLIIINSPQNPSCTVADGADLDALAALIRDRPITVLADEVYEHVLYDGRRHASVLAHSELRERSFAVFSFGKTLHATGWRVGYCVAPPALTRELRKVHQFNTFSIVSPLQYAIARYLAAHLRCVDRDVGRFFKPSGTCSPGFCWARASTHPGRRYVFPAGRLRRSQRRQRRGFRRPPDPRGQNRDHFRCLPLCSAAGNDAAAPLRRQATMQTLESAAERLCAFAAAPAHEEEPPGACLTNDRRASLVRQAPTDSRFPRRRGADRRIWRCRIRAASINMRPAQRYTLFSLTVRRIRLIRLRRSFPSHAHGDLDRLRCFP